MYIGSLGIVLTFQHIVSHILHLLILMVTHLCHGVSITEKEKVESDESDPETEGVPQTLIAANPVFLSREFPYVCSISL